MNTPKTSTERSRAFRARHPGRANEHWARFRTRKAGLIPVYIEADFCLVCGFPLVSDLRYPHPLSTSVGHEPPISRARYFISQRPEHLVCNAMKGTWLDGELSPAQRDRIDAVVTEAFRTV